jgi:hypothetical protein
MPTPGAGALRLPRFASGHPPQPAASGDPLDGRLIGYAGLVLALVAAGGAIVLAAARRQLRELTP